MHTQHTLHCSVQSDCFLYMFTKIKHLIFFFIYKKKFYFFSFIKKSSAGNKILHCILLRKGEIRPNFRQYWHLCILIKNTYKTHFHWETNKATIYFSLARAYYFFSTLSFYWKCFELEPALKPTETSMQDWALLCLYNTIHTYCILAISRNLV